MRVELGSILNEYECNNSPKRLPEERCLEVLRSSSEGPVVERRKLISERLCFDVFKSSSLAAVDLERLKLNPNFFFFGSS